MGGDPQLIKSQAGVWLIKNKKSVWHMSLYFGRGLGKNEAEWTGKREN